MTIRLTGIRADRKRSYRDLEATARRVRNFLKLGSSQALDALNMFENLDQVSLEMRDGRLIPFRECIASLDDSEGYTRYDAGKNIMEIVASESTYRGLERR